VEDGRPSSRGHGTRFNQTYVPMEWLSQGSPTARSTRRAG
jgi:hypothetical protein